MTETPCRIGFVIVTHGILGEELLRVTRYILGKELENFRAVEVPFMGEMQPAPTGGTPFADRRVRIRTLIAAAMTAVEHGNGVMILTDLIGGTSSNVAQEILAEKNGAVIAGVNLPMLLKAATLDTTSLAAAAADLVRRSRNAIQQLPDKID